MADDSSGIKLEAYPTDFRQTDSSHHLGGMANGKLPAHRDVDEDLIFLPFAEARGKALERFDRQFLSAALARNNGNIARTARSLGLHRQSLQKLMARRGIKSIRNALPPAASVSSN